MHPIVDKKKFSAFKALSVSRHGGVQKVCTSDVTSLRRRFSCNTFVANLEVQDTAFLDTHIQYLEVNDERTLSNDVAG